MKGRIKYALACVKGRGEKNQDNFWCSSTFLPCENSGLATVITGNLEISRRPVFSIFDGMGGEQCGEVASYLAACSFHEFQNNNDSDDPESFLLAACQFMNQEICDYRKAKAVNRMGTTAAILLFNEKAGYLCNIGDSRIYQRRKNTLEQLSVDHSDFGIRGRKAPLTQHLGIAEDEFIIEPFISTINYKKGDKFLVCSDGLSDVLSSPEILTIIKKQKSLTKAVTALVENVKERKGHDDITIILCEVQ